MQIQTGHLQENMDQLQDGIREGIFLPNSDSGPYGKDTISWSITVQKLEGLLKIIDKTEHGIASESECFLEVYSTLEFFISKCGRNNTDTNEDQEYKKFLARQNFMQSNLMSHKVNLDGLNTFMNEFSRNGEEHFAFITNLKRMISYALELPSNFPLGKIPKSCQGSPSILKLTRKQVACLLSHMFFCTIIPQPTETHDYEQKQTFHHFCVSFQEWHESTFSTSLAYLQCLFTYFGEVAAWSVHKLSEELTFCRKVLSEEKKPKWNVSEARILPVEISENGRIGDVEGYTETDFANKDIGYGKTGTQEEILFGMSPEMCVARLFCDTLADNESFVITGAHRIGQHSGYGFDLVYQGQFVEDWDWKSRVVLAIDALPFETDSSDVISLLKQQLDTKSLLRELNKCFCGFNLNDRKQMSDLTPLLISSHINTREFHIPKVTNKCDSTALPIATGHWGCGAFGGNKEIKAAIQIIAASQAHCIKLHYYSFGDKCFSENLRRFLEVVQSKNLKVKDLLLTIQQYKSYISSLEIQSHPLSLFDFFLSY